MVYAACRPHLQRYAAHVADTFAALVAADPEPELSLLREGYLAHAPLIEAAPFGPAARANIGRFPRVMVGINAWAMIGLLTAYERLTDEDGERRARWLAAARELGATIEEQWRRPASGSGAPGGYVLGWDGWVSDDLYEAVSTEHCIDLYVAYKRLAAHDAEDSPRWLRAAAHARAFVEAAFQPGASGGPGHFLTGTTPAGAWNETFHPLDPNTWAILALAGEPGAATDPRFAEALRWLERSCAIVREDPLRGFDFDAARQGPELWLEGTAQVACVYRMLGRHAEADALCRLIESHQADSGEGRGAIPATDGSVVSTGMSGFAYYGYPHTGATAWYLFAQRAGINPYWGPYEGPR